MAKIELLKKIDNLFGSFLCRILPGAGICQPCRISRILLIRPGGIGDAVLLAPSLHLLRQYYPDAIIDVLVEKRNSGVFDLIPEVDKVYIYDSLFGFLSSLRKTYDVVVDTEQWHRLSAVVARLIKAEMRIGFATNERRRLFDCPVEYSQDDYEADSFLHLLRPLEVDASVEVDTSFLVVPDFSRKQADDHLSALKGQPYIVIFPGASIPERQWSVAKFAELASRIACNGIGVVVVGGSEDKLSGDTIVENIEYGLNLAGCCDLAGSAGVIANARLLVSGDSGILHIGVGLGKPTVSIFGPGIAKKWAPRGEQHRVINKGIDCSPCTKFGNTPKCPVNVKCLDAISVDEVYGAAMELLEVKG